MNTNREDVMKVLDRGIIAHVLPAREEFIEALLSGRKLRFYIGADPTSNALHLSHAKNYMLLEEFRRLGHEVIVLIGDFTARIGDPTERSAARKQLSKEEVENNVKSWVDQIRPLLDFGAADNPPRLLYNNDWLSKLTMEEVINLAANVTVQQLLERDMFEKRVEENKPIYLHEFMYPLMQGYDSVAMDVDVELCGTDQIFNALMGRTLLKKLKNKDKFVVAVNLMENPKTKELMSKSRGTGVFLNVSAENMFAGIMAQPDEMIKVFLVNNTRLPLEEIETIMETANPRDAKMRAAFEVTRIFHGAEGARLAQDAFVKKFQKRETPDDLAIVSVGAEKIKLFEILQKCLAGGESKSEIRRLITQGGVKADGETKDKVEEMIAIPENGLVLKVGKKNWFKIVR